jgi:hypothetical protein
MNAALIEKAVMASPTAVAFKTMLITFRTYIAPTIFIA